MPGPAHKREKMSEPDKNRTSVPEEEQEDGKKNRGKKALMAAVALVASASVSIAGFFSEPAALLDRDIKIPSAQVDVIVDDDDDEGDENDEKEQKEGFAEKARALILRIPFAIRSTVGVAMWTLGWVIIKLASVLWIGVLSPILGFILKSLLTFLILAAVIGAIIKLLFPWLRWRDIFNWRNLAFLFALSVLLNLCDLILPMVWKDYTRVKNLVTFLLYAAVSLTVIIAASIRINRWKDRLAMLMTG